MRYLGGKYRIATELASVLNRAIEHGNGRYIEPFCGMCSVGAKIQATDRLMADCNRFVIALWRALQSGWQPPDHVTRERYETLKANPESHHPALVAFAGYGYSFGGKWFGGYTGPSTSAQANEKLGGPKRSALRKIDALRTARFMCADYREHDITPGTIVYCDIPYPDTTGYITPFDPGAFWVWAGEQARRGVGVFVSGYETPAEPLPVTVVWQKRTERQIDRNGVVKTEILFLIRG